MKPNYTLLLTCAATLTIACHADAAMMLTIDTLAKTLTLTGTDTVTLEEEFVFTGPPTGEFEGNVSWLFGSSTGPFEIIDPGNSAIESAFEGFNGTDPNSKLDHPRFTVYVSNGFALSMIMRDTDSELAEFGGTGVPFSYAGLLTPDAESYLESLDGQSLAVSPSVTSSGQSPIPIQIIPEPSSLALLGVGGLVVARRRR